jgi:ATP-dependent DNA helicase PIF1
MTNLDEQNDELDGLRPGAGAGVADDDLLASLEISTGALQHGQVADEAGLAAGVSAMPDHMRACDEAPTPCAFVTGIAGSGKTYLVKERNAADWSYAALAASTGIAAINLGTATVHSLLGFFDTDSLRDAYIRGSLQRKIRKIADEGYRNVIVDECSMISEQTLDLLVRGFDDANERRRRDGWDPIGLILVGDFCQLPPIADRPPGSGGPGSGRRVKLPTPWAFQSTFWPRFAANETRLTKVWRQADQRFLAALNHARSGRGRDCMEVLRAAGQRFEMCVDHDFEGTTIVGKNDEVDRINEIRLIQVKGREVRLPSRRWGVGNKMPREWQNVPTETKLREGCYVMILANKYDPDRGRDMVYANGDCGWVRGVQAGVGGPPSILVELVRTGEVVAVESLVRGVHHEGAPEFHHGGWQEEKGRYQPEPHVRKAQSKRMHVTAQIEYFPLRVAYASTVHKAQGLTLDKCQIDFRGWMFKGMHAMTYTSLSRCRTLGGLRLVGSPELLAERCYVDARVRRWL